jgi:hypothetical protein
VRLYEDDNSIHSVHIGFAEALIGRINAPQRLDVLEAALRLGYRFRWEILEEYKGFLTEPDVEKIEGLLKRIEREAARRGPADPETLGASFGCNERQRIVDMFTMWVTYRTRDGSGRLDEAFRKKDPKQLRQCLDELAPMNAEFMRLGARRFEELVAEHWPGRPS